MTMTQEKWTTPPAIARMLGVTNNKILDAIRCGKLKAVNLSEGDRPRWKVSPTDLQRFLDSKSNQIAVTEPPRSRREIPKPTKRWV
jgi:hypothetical protein